MLRLGRRLSDSSARLALCSAPLARSRIRCCVAPRAFAAAPGQPLTDQGSGSKGPPPTKSAAPQRPVGLVSPSGAPIASTAAAGGADGIGQEVQLNAQNAAQVLQSQTAFILQVGSPGDVIGKKIQKLRTAAAGRLPLVKLDCETLPQICQALQIQSSPTVLLMARGQVAAALEGDLSPQAATAFVERVAQALGLKVNLTEGAFEQLAEAEEAEWAAPESAEEVFGQIVSAADMQLEARIRATAGRARCALRLGGRRDEAKADIDELETQGHGRLPEVKQAAAMLWLDGRRSVDKGALEQLRAAAQAEPIDVAAVEAFAVSTFWAGHEGEAVDAGLALLRKKRTEETRQLVLALVEALGPRHPRHKAARRGFNNANFA